ncbi:oligosaccharyltransferase complex subunit epsilon [Taxawa tesnikishii (nom. ined.)]|nr:oligosaccharyltransferase complex subunit epsilon [Dothideales sp. JES 119]
MAPKQAAKEPAPSSIPPSVAAPSHGQTSGSSQPTKPAVKSSSSVSNRPAKTPPTSLRNAQDAQEILVGIWNRYVEETPQRVKLMDVFMAFLVVVGVLQFVYCIVAGNYPFNAFLSGFAATVGQFVLTASLRIQTNPENKADFGSISHERAFADYVFGSLLLHFFCVNFIN